MRMPSILVAAALVMVPTLLPVQNARAQDMKGMNMKVKPAASPADKAFAASMQTMMKNMKVKPTGKPDKDFVLMMMPHHQGAIDMAKVELQCGTDPQLRQIGDRHRCRARKRDRANEGLAREKRQVTLTEPDADGIANSGLCVRWPTHESKSRCGGWWRASARS